MTKIAPYCLNALIKMSSVTGMKNIKKHKDCTSPSHSRELELSDNLVSSAAVLETGMMLLRGGDKQMDCERSASSGF